MSLDAYQYGNGDASYKAAGELTGLTKLVDAWMLCMQKAVAEQPYEESFKHYLLAQLAVPAERIRQACAL